MTRLVIAEKEELVRRLRSRVEECLGKVLASVNAARDGHLIEDSEKAANDLLNELKRQVYEEALQTRIDATEASFSPSGRRRGSKVGGQRAAELFATDPAGAGGDPSAALPAAGGGEREPAG